LADCGSVDCVAMRGDVLDLERRTRPQKKGCGTITPAARIDASTVDMDQRAFSNQPVE
jgi:hypothetical protein